MVSLVGLKTIKLTILKQVSWCITCHAIYLHYDLPFYFLAVIQGPSDTPYEKGSFLLDIEIPDKYLKILWCHLIFSIHWNNFGVCRYPMDPPQIKFITKVYHPNIDSSNGLICLDLLKKPPHGKWTPVINLCSLLTAIQQLLADPNPHDPLDAAVVSWLLIWASLNHLILLFIYRPKSTSLIDLSFWRMPLCGLSSMPW